jgi:type IX secretion system PorP/SprF family membrane protein
MTKRLLILLFFALVTSVSYAQDIHFTQFYASPTYLNPAFTGAGGCSRASITYRNQWPGISKAYKTYLAYVDHFIPEYSIGGGLLVASDVAGSGGLRTTLIMPSIAYETRIGRTFGMRAGFQPGVGIRSINYDKLMFGDQLYRGGNVPTIEAPPLTKAYFDIGAGMLFYNDKYWAGFSANHLNRPDESLIEAEAQLPVKYSLHGGAKFKLEQDSKDLEDRKTFTTAFNYRGQQDFDQLDIGFYFTRYVVNVGLWYRGLPGVKAYKPGYSNNDALAVIVGFNNDNFNLGYSYDMTISKLAKLSSGAHEISLTYTMCKKRKKKRKMIVPCPKF